MLFNYSYLIFFWFKKAAVRDKNLHEIWFSLSFEQVARKVRTSVSELSQWKINYFQNSIENLNWRIVFFSSIFSSEVLTACQGSIFLAEQSFVMAAFSPTTTFSVIKVISYFAWIMKLSLEKVCLNKITHSFVWGWRSVHEFGCHTIFQLPINIKACSMKQQLKIFYI